MAAPVSVIATTTNATGSGSASLNAGAVVNKFAVEVVVAQPGDGRLELVFNISTDGQTFMQADPSEQDGNAYLFDEPATNVQVLFSGNAPGNAVTVTAYAFTD